MDPLFTSEQSRQIDQLLIDRTPIAAYELMQRAAKACLHTLRERWSNAGSVAILTGYGNNGGDGYVLGELLLAENIEPVIYEITDSPSGSDVFRARQDYLRAGGVSRPLSELVDITADVIVDALFGTGLNRPLPETVIALIGKINQSVTPVLSVDIPSGLNADTGQAMPCAVEAAVTVTFIVRKQGMYTAYAKDACGQIVYADLQMEKKHFLHIKPSAYLSGLGSIPRLPPRKRDTHKGDYGRVLIVGGDFGMVGAVCLAGMAALRCGVGKVCIATRPEHTGTVVSVCPELMAYGISSASELTPLLNNSDVVIVGPGLGQNKWSRSLFTKILERDHPKVIDADALVLLGKEPMYNEHWVLTPHPGEARVLLNKQNIQADRYSASKDIVARYGGSCVLKGAGTIVCSKDITLVCAIGNPGMATAGVGDVLSGVIAALIAQGMPTSAAAVSGVCVHASAGDRAIVNGGQRGMIATDMIPYLRIVMQ